MIPLEHSKFQLCVKLSKGHRAIAYLVQTEERRDINSITLLHDHLTYTEESTSGLMLWCFYSTVFEYVTR